MSLLEQSKAVRTFILPEVNKVISSIEMVNDDVAEYKTDIVAWLKPVIDVSGYYVYPMNGITEGLNWWMANESRGIYMDAGDYQWVQETGTDIKYMSNPSSIDGMIKDTKAIALDLAYVGSTAIKRIEHDADYIFFSLSKPFGVRNIRTGWMFTKKPEPKLELLIYNAKYYNYFAHSVAETIINKFDIDYIYNRLNRYQHEVCDEFDLKPSDSVWLATTTNPLYDKFKRGDVNRVCISQEISAAFSR